MHPLLCYFSYNLTPGTIPIPITVGPPIMSSPNSENVSIMNCQGGGGGREGETVELNYHSATIIAPYIYDTRNHSYIPVIVGPPIMSSPNSENLTIMTPCTIAYTLIYYLYIKKTSEKVGPFPILSLFRGSTVYKVYHHHSVDR